MYKEKKEYPLIEAEVYQCELLSLDLKQVETYSWRKGEKEGEQFENNYKFQFVILEGKNRGLSLWSDFIPTFLYNSPKSGKNKLYKIVEALLGRDLSQGELQEGLTGDFLNSLIGKQCRVIVEHKQSKDGTKTFANTTNWMKVNTPLSPLVPEEKEKARPKTKPQSPPSGVIEPGNAGYTDVSSIPF